MSQACHRFWKCYKEPPKVVRTCGVLNILTSKCASRHSSVHFFDISTSKSGPRMVCFVHLDFEMCFAPQQRALFRRRNFQKWSEPGVVCIFWLRHVFRATTACTFSNFQKWSEPGVFCTFWLGNVLRVTTACNFSSLIWPTGSAPAALASLLFDPPETQIIGKTQCLATFLPFHASASSFFWLFLFSHLLSSTLRFSLTLPISAFHLSILSEVWLLNFLRLDCYYIIYSEYQLVTYSQVIGARNYQCQWCAEGLLASTIGTSNCWYNTPNIFRKSSQVAVLAILAAHNKEVRDEVFETWQNLNSLRPAASWESVRWEFNHQHCLGFP